jgi:8-oxo-dGTP diphosphatase
MDVAVGIVSDDKHRLLITKRPLDKQHGGLWEFPGGKVEAGETALNALVRELKEEVDIDVLAARLLDTIEHHYPTFSVRLLVFWVDDFEGIASAIEGQADLKWAEVDELWGMNFPEANEAIISLVSQQLLDLADG